MRSMERNKNQNKIQSINRRIYRLMGGFFISLNLLFTACGGKEPDNSPVLEMTEDEAENPAVSEETEDEIENPAVSEETEDKAENPAVSEETDDRIENPAVLEETKAELDTTMDFSRLYKQKCPITEAEDFEGSWNRTNISSAFEAVVDITNQDENGFWFTGEFCYYSHTGTVEGQAYWITEDMAIYEYIADIDTGREYILFKKQEEQLNIVASASSGKMGFGANVTADGEYTQEIPVYTNANVLEENFDSRQREDIRQMLGEDFYQEYFVWVVENGVLIREECILEEGGTAIYYQGFVPTMGGYSFELLSCADGRLYFLSESDAMRYQTNTQGELDFPLYYYIPEATEE